MEKYKLTEDGVKNSETTAFIPNDKGNNDWKEYQNWLKGLDAEGEDLGTGPNKPDPQFTPEEIEAKKQFDKTQAANDVVNARIKLDAATAEGLEIEAECLTELKAARKKLTALKTIKDG